MILQRSVRVLLSVALPAILAALAANHTFYDSSISATFYPYIFASVIYIHLRLAFRWKDLAGILIVGILFILLDVFVLHPHTVYWTSCISFLGMGSLVVMGLRATWCEKEERTRVLLALIPGALILGSNFFAGYLHLWTEKAHPKVLDLYLYSFDSSLKLPIAFWFGQAFATAPLLERVSTAFYVGLPFALALVYAGQAVRLRVRAIPVVAALLLAGPLGGVFYNLFPALGPVHVFGQRFPWDPLPVESVRRLLVAPVPLEGLRNAMPSLHMGWALLCFWYSRGLSLWERSIALAFVVFTFCATLGTGEHYFIDLVVAVPFALLIQAMFTTALEWSDPRRWLPICFGLAATVGWLVALRFALPFFWISTLLPWTACVLTVALSFLARRGLKDPAVGIGAPAGSVWFSPARTATETTP